MGMSNEKLFELLREDWSNNSCLGYALMGMVETKLTKEQIVEVINNMKEAFEFHTVEEAKEYYCGCPYC